MRGSPTKNPSIDQSIVSAMTFSASGEVRPITTQVDKEIDPMFVDEFILGYETRVFDDWTLGIKGTYREMGTAIDDVAMHLGLSVDTARQRLNRGLNRLHKRLTRIGVPFTSLALAVTLRELSAGESTFDETPAQALLASSAKSSIDYSTAFPYQGTHLALKIALPAAVLLALCLPPLVTTIETPANTSPQIKSCLLYTSPSPRD